MSRGALPGVCAVLLLCGCDGDTFGPGSGNEDWNLDAAYRWNLEGWQTNGTRPIGHPSVLVTWDLPDGWDGGPFRVYAKDSDDAVYGLAATVTSCSGSSCSYSDRNVAPGQSYDYYVTSLDRNDRETDSSDEIRISVPAASAPATPGGVTARSLDHAVFVQWLAGQTPAQRYVVYLQDGSELITVGETDGTSYFDPRAENGNRYEYRVAAVNGDGHYSDLSGAVAGIPRPDYHAEVIFALGDSARLSGFRFRASDSTDPLLDGNSASAQWRLEMVNGRLSIRPLGGTQVTSGADSSELACGPGSDSDCVSVDRAPTTGFQSTPVAVAPAQTYVLRVTGDDNQTHFGKVRVVGTTTINGRNAMVFDWAYQLRSNEASLNLVAR